MQTAAALHCELCGLDCTRDPLLRASLAFCCTGCRNVYEILVESGVAASGADLRNTDLFRRSLELGLISNGARKLAPVEIPAGTALQEKLYHVSGMWCGSCAWLIEHTLAREPGIASVEVFFTSDLLKVRYYPQYLAPGRIEERLRSFGYTASGFDGGDNAADAERKTLLLRLGIAAFLWINVMTLNLAVYIGYFESLGGSMRRVLPFVVMLLATPVVFYSALPVLQAAWHGLRERVVRMETLLTLGVVSAYGYSAVQAFRGGTHIYFDIACAIVTLVLLGKFIERGAKESTTRAMRMLHRNLPTKVRLAGAAGERFVNVDALQPGDVFLVKAGERIAADGIVAAGDSHSDESIITGESAPVSKTAGARVLGGSLNVSGTLEVRATTIAGESTLAQVVRAVERALSSRSDIERTVDRIARRFVPVVIALAIVAGLGSWWGGLDPGEAIMRAVTILVIACPCALGIATPLALTGAVGAASRAGILLSDSRVLEAIRKIDTVVMDKTGTVTEGNFKLLEYNADHLGILASLEAYSEHPLGRSVVERALDMGLALQPAVNVRVEKGRGITGRVGGCDVFIGNRQLALVPETVSLTATTAYYGWDGVLRGRLVFGDRVRAEAAETIAQFQLQGRRVVILSGDSQAATEAVARETGADEFYAEVLPAGKLNLIEELRAQGRTVAMIGDGVNDAPALAAASLGIAMGSGTDIAMKAAAMVLMTNRLDRVPAAFDLASRTMRVVRQNLFWAFFYNVAGITLAAAGILNPIIAAGAMAASSLFVVANSHRLAR